MIWKIKGTFLLPIFREFLLQAGAMAASRSSLETVLRKPGGGEAPVLMVLRHALDGDDDGVMLIAGGMMWSYRVFF